MFYKKLQLEGKAHLECSGERKKTQNRIRVAATHEVLGKLHKNKASDMAP